MFTDLIAAIEECRFRALTERTGNKPKRYLSVIQLNNGFMRIVETTQAKQFGNRIMYSVGCDRHHTVLPEAR
ncbi:hypothetical protein PH4a_02885 [Proteus hauseri]|nr:hypothetical protein PH4a_00985 [Proteus hauseri]QAV22345.1 hypothetical protein PH4a_02885 [Proteus hauseri]